MAIAAGIGYMGAQKTAKAGERGAAGIAGAAAEDRAMQERMFNMQREDQRPFMEAGYDALGRQEAFLNGDMSGFENNAGHKFALAQGLQAADRGAAAGASYRSGGADVDRMNYATGLASQTADSYWDKLRGLAGQGSSTVTNLGQFGANAANQMGQSGLSAATARASSYAQGANAWADYGNSMAGMINYGNQNAWGQTNQYPPSQRGPR